MPPCLPLTLYTIGLLAVTLAMPGSVIHAQTAPDCLPPVPPLPVTDPATRAEYRREIGEEYAAYFDDAQSYLRCLETARASVTDEVNRVIADYQRLGTVPDD